MAKKIPVEKPPRKDKCKVISLLEHRKKKLIRQEPCGGFCLICNMVNECEEFLAELEEEWSEELYEISQEEDDQTIYVSMSPRRGKEFLEVLKDTLLFQFVKVRKDKTRTVVCTNKETVGRLMVAELVDMGINFSYRVKYQP
jgi:hypothetical protein